jgi:alkanesulfonate monooxygenase SsuD/methylene tetrahydromethanopterin reductase-like flavin-dependent oxidoreductase (luciferase family)
VTVANDKHKERSAMHFGQFNLMGYRYRGTSVGQIYDNTVEQVKAAEKAGFEASWFAEHHFSNYCACPSPLMMVARLAGETTRIKLGTAVVVTPLYNPARLLAEIGMVEALTHGRLLLGVGSGYQPYEFERFGEDLSNSAEQLIEFMQMLELAFSRETFSYSGKHYSMPETHIATRPRDGARIPIWTAGENPKLVQFAARQGYITMLSPRHFNADLLEVAKQRLKENYAAAGADPAKLRFGMLRHICITDDKAEAASFLDNVRHQIRLSQSLRLREEALDGGMLIEKTYPGEPPIEDLARFMLIGDATTVAERLAEEIRRTGPSHVMLQFQAGASDQGLALRSIERFAGEVRPMLEKALGPLDRISPM